MGRYEHWCQLKHFLKKAYTFTPLPTITVRSRQPTGSTLEALTQAKPFP